MVLIGISFQSLNLLAVIFSPSLLTLNEILGQAIT